MMGPWATDDQVANLKQSLGLDQPLPLQYFHWLKRVIRGDLGMSFVMQIPVSSELWGKFQATLLLTMAAVLVSSTIGLCAGIVSAVFRGTLLDRTVMVGSLLGLSVPVFWLGIIFIIIFSLKLNWFPVGGMFPGTGGGPLDVLPHLVLPAISLGAANAGYISRFTRSDLIEVLSEDYIRTAASKGLSRMKILTSHALRNVMIRVVTVQGLQFGYLLGGAVLTETVFSWPGIGTALLKAILARDFPMIQGGVLLVAVCFTLVNLFVDILYAYIDPRIRYR